MMKYSVITVSYNNLAGLKSTAESVLAQTSRDYEWLVFDGGSEDGSKEFLESLGDRVSYWESLADGGIYDAMNKGIRKANGEYLVFMNAGDRFVDAEVLDKVSKYKSEAGVIYGDWLESDLKGRHIHAAPKTADIGFFCEDNICHQAMFIKAELMKRSEYEVSVGAYADWAKWIEFSAEGVEFRYVPIVVCEYESGGISTKVNPLESFVRMLAGLKKPYASRVVAHLLTRGKISLAEFLGIRDVGELSCGARLKYKLCNKLCKTLRRDFGDR